MIRLFRQVVNDSMKELISVIIPAYNVEPYIERCLKSVVNQTYKNLEIIIINDGSTDNTPFLCDKWEKQDKRIRVIHKENGGLSSARNIGIENAQGDYLAFVDSDDWIEIDMYEYLIQLIKLYSVDVAFCDFARKRNKRKIQLKNRKEKIVVREGEDIDRYFYRINGEKSSYAVWCGLYKSTSIKDIRFIENEINEDVLFRYEIYKKVRKIAFSNLYKYNYFVNKEGITQRKLSQKDYSLFRIWDYIVTQEQSGGNYEWAKINRLRAIYTLYLKGIIIGNEDISENELKEWKASIKENGKVLMKGKLFDWKRKIILLCIIWGSVNKK